MEMPLFWIATLIAAVAGWVDSRRHEIPDGFPLALAGCGLAGAALGALSWPAVAAGAALGFGIGAALFALGAFGGGDAKLLAGIGACLGPWVLLAALVPIAVAGGVLSLIAAARGAQELAYGPAMAVGLLAHGLMTHWPPA